MLARHSDIVDPWRLCSQGKTVSGKLLLSDLKRLAPLLASSAGEAAFVFRFDRDEEGRAILVAEVEAVLSVVCQRCLEACEWPVATSSRLALVQGYDEAGRLPDELDPLLLPEPRLEPVKLVEDELLLALPAVPMHALDACRPPLASSEPLASAAEPSEPANPFAVLATLRSNNNGKA